jgi:predicted O-methyltransferase YrrM
MTLSTPAADAVLAAYDARLAEETRRMAALGPAGFALRDEFLLPVGPEVGAFLHALVLARRPRRILELGTSYGYSTLFLADAAQAVCATVVTLELAEAKQAYARQMIEKAGLSASVEFRLGDAVELIRADPGPFDLVLLDIWKELYIPCLDAFYPKLSDEGVIVADNMIDPPMSREDVRRYRSAVRERTDLQTALLPIGSGIELSVRWTPGNTKL